jgi:hypothetical protein
MADSATDFANASIDNASFATADKRPYSSAGTTADCRTAVKSKFDLDDD